MSRTDTALDGNAPDKAYAALLIVDVINDLEFDEGEELLRHAMPAAKRLKALKTRFREAGLPVIYANDNFGRWQSDFHAQVNHCLKDHVRGYPIVKLLKPESEDYFVLKPKHSAFYSTTLDLLLSHLQVESLVITGFATDMCVLFTSNDAYMRDFRVYVPSDCVAANTKQRSEESLALMKRVLKADVRPSTKLDLDQLDL